MSATELFVADTQTIMIQSYRGPGKAMCNFYGSQECES